MIRAAASGDWPFIWDILQPVFRAGETYAVPTDISEDAAHALWIEAPQAAFVAEVDGLVAGTYYLKPNHPGPGGHVANCGYAVNAAAQGQGVATAMCRHSLQVARSMGFRAMQYNLVAATNARAVALWQREGFEIVARLPGAFQHPSGYVDAHVMYQSLI